MAGPCTPLSVLDKRKLKFKANLSWAYRPDTLNTAKPFARLGCCEIDAMTLWAKKQLGLMNQLQETHFHNKLLIDMLGFR